jgi:class 3 adenylate cyclase
LQGETVVIAATTRRLVGNLFEYRDLGSVEVKGITAPVPADALGALGAKHALAEIGLKSA